MRLQAKRAARRSRAKSGWRRAVPPPGPVADSYGAGDAFAAGLTYALGAGREPAESAAFAATIAAEQLSAPPEEGRRPPRPDDAGLVDTFKAGAVRLVEVLREADQSTPCWTWAGWQQDTAFITRHQVQEAAVHHWDAANAAGGLLWRALAKGATRDQLAAKLAAEYGLTAERAAADTDAFIAALQEHDLLHG